MLEERRRRAELLCEAELTTAVQSNHSPTTETQLVVSWSAGLWSALRWQERSSQRNPSYRHRLYDDLTVYSSPDPRFRQTIQLGSFLLSHRHRLLYCWNRFYIYLYFAGI